MVVIWLYWRKPSDYMNVFLEGRGCVCPELNPGASHQLSIYFLIKL